MRSLKLATAVFLIIFTSTFCFAEDTGDFIELPTIAENKISQSQYVVGGLLGTVAGFGLGHAVQDRYSLKAKIFTIGELASSGAILLSVIGCMGDPAPGQVKDRDCAHNKIYFAGLFTYVFLRIWEIGDVWLQPPLTHSIALTIIPPDYKRPAVLAARFSF